MEDLKQHINLLNKEIKLISHNKFDLRTIRNALEFSPDTKMTNELFMDTYLINYITDEVRGKIKEEIAKIPDDDHSRAFLKELLTRKILYIGAECEQLGLIDIEKEFELLKATLVDEYLSIVRVDPPTADNFIDQWDIVRPNIIFMSCHGNEYGLFLKNKYDLSTCKHVLNTELKYFFDTRSEYTECVVLSACQSLELGKNIRDSGKHVVSINAKVNINTATQFLIYFLKHLNNHSLDNSDVYEHAYTTAIEKIEMESLPDTFSFAFEKAAKIF